MVNNLRRDLFSLLKASCKRLTAGNVDAISVRGYLRYTVIRSVGPQLTVSHTE